MNSSVSANGSHTCDIVSEKVPYGETNIVGPDQTPDTACNVRHLVRDYDICHSSLMIIYIKDFHRSLCCVKHKFYHKRVKIADLG